jgi:Flp pilus assembly protein TadG
MHMATNTNTPKITTIEQGVAQFITASRWADEAVTAIQGLLKGHMSPEQVSAKLMPHVAEYYGHTLVAKTRGKGMTWDREVDGWETAKKMHQRLCSKVLGETSAQEVVAVPRALDSAVYDLLTKYTKAQIKAALAAYK